MTARQSRTEAALIKRDRAQTRLEEATAELHEAIVDDLDDKHTKVELAALIGVSRERIRLIEIAVRDRRAKEGRWPSAVEVITEHPQDHR